MQVVSLTDDEWKTLREARLRALAEAPYAFWAAHADEAAYDEEQWRRFARAAAWFAARRGGRVVGLAAGLVRPEVPGEAELMALWVEPDERRRGVATGLVHAIRCWGLEWGVRDIYLWVTEGNRAASLLYERLGFQFTGERAPLPRDPSIAEIRMRAPLAGAEAPREDDHV